MDADRLTLPDMSRLMRKLAANFGGKKDLEEKADLWYDKLERYPLSVVERVVSRLLDEEHQYFPTVGRAVALARELNYTAPGAPTDHAPPQTLAERYREWERDPWATIQTLDHDRVLCTSAPCPVCGSVIQYSDRGAVIVHDRRRHTEAAIGYGNIGNPKWFEMGPPTDSPSPSWADTVAKVAKDLSVECPA